MTQRTERWLTRLLNLAAVVLIVTASTLVYCAVVAEPFSIVMQEPPIQSSTANAAQTHPAKDDLAQKLASARMTRTVAPKAEVAPPKAPVPKLSSILRLKGIMDFGDPKSNEAILENLRTNQTRSYKAGQSVDGVDAKIIKIENEVFFEYDGQKIKLDMNGDEAASALPVAGQGGDALSQSNGTKE